MTITVLLQDVKKLEADAVIVGFFEDVRPLKNLAGTLDWLLCGALSDLILRDKVNGRVGEIALLTSQKKIGIPKIFMAGMGLREAATAAVIRDAVGTAVKSVSATGARTAAIECFPVPGVPFNELVSAFFSGAARSGAGGLSSISLLAPDAAAYEKMVEQVQERSTNS